MSDREQAALADWLSALDDMFTARYPRRCILCGGPSAWAEIRTAPVCPSLAVSLCAPCEKNDPPRARLDALLEQRYGTRHQWQDGRA